MVRYEVVMHADSSFLQVFIWERFPTIVSKLIEFLTVVTKEVMQANDSKKIKSSGTHKPRAWRWLNTKPLASKSLKVMDKKESFCSRASPTCLRGRSSPHCLGRQMRRLSHTL